MKDNVTAHQALRLGAIVGWEQTFRSSAEVLQRRVVWGEVRDFYHHPGDSEGHYLKGDYVYVLLQDGSDLFVHVNDIVSVQP